MNLSQNEIWSNVVGQTDESASIKIFIFGNRYGKMKRNETSFNKSNFFTSQSDGKA
jgi:hypothetical protein